MKNRTLAIVGVTTAWLCAATLVGRAAAQSTSQSTQTSSQTATQPEPPPPHGPGPGGPPGPFGGGPMGMMPFGGGPGGPFGGAEVVTGAPYSAQAVTEITQTLADGNRIVKKVTASVYRDSSGRVRRDQVLAAVGSWMPDAQPKTAFIDDPVAHYHYILNPDKQTAVRFPEPDRTAFKNAHKDQASSSSNTGSNSTTGSTTSSTGGSTSGSNSGSASDSGAPPEDGPRHRGPGTVTKTSLGTQTIEGVQATGTQSVLTIEAGAIGNDQAIRIVSEEWYSPDLKTVVLSKRSDPRFGDTLYQLTQISRSEPDATLFQVPAAYTVSDASARQGHFGGGPPRGGRRPE